MAGDRLLEIFELIKTIESDYPHDAALCMASAKVVGMDGAGVFLLAESALTHWCSSNSVASDIMDLEIVLQEGPGQDANESGHLSSNEDLAENIEWAFYAPEAVRLGARSVYGFPLTIGFHKLGALILYDTEPCALSEAQLTDGYLMASVIGRDVLAADPEAPQPALNGELGGPSNFDFALHQAAGMISVQAALPVRDALTTIRSHAFTVGISPRALASRIVNRQIRFDHASKEWITQ